MVDPSAKLVSGNFASRAGEFTKNPTFQAGPSRDALIHSWCASVWEAWKDSHDDIANLAKNELGIL
jgi:hypothetical protein